MADVLWGAPTAWADVVASATLSALAINSMVSSAAIDNTTLRDTWCEVSFINTTAAATIAAGSHLAFYVLPLSHDGTNYPAGSAAGTTLPSMSYLAGIIGFPAASAQMMGNTRFQVPYGTFKINMVNRMGTALTTTTTAMTLRYRLISEAVV